VLHDIPFYRFGKMTMKSILTTLSDEGTWETRWNALAHGRLWSSLLIGLGTVSSIVSPHAALVGFATVAGATLTHRRAIATSLTIWLLNQAYGYGMRGYPQTGESLGWGLIMGIGTVLVTWFALMQPTFSRKSLTNHAVWVVLSALAGICLYQGLLVAYSAFLNAEHALTPELVRQIAVKELTWAIALTGVYGAVCRLR
jgi:uncharacterized membrane protein (DUF485 family)